MEVVYLGDHVLRSCAPGGDPLCLRRSGSSPERYPTASDVDCAALEVERARDATHSAVALRSAATAGDSEVRMDCQKPVGVQSGMWCESFDVVAVLHYLTPNESAGQVSG